MKVRNDPCLHKHFIKLYFHFLGIEVIICVGALTEDMLFLVLGEHDFDSVGNPLHSLDGFLGKSAYYLSVKGGIAKGVPHADKAVCSRSAKGVGRLDYGNLCTKSCGSYCRAHACASSADYHYIHVVDYRNHT